MAPSVYYSDEKARIHDKNVKEVLPFGQIWQIAFFFPSQLLIYPNFRAKCFQFNSFFPVLQRAAKVIQFERNWNHLMVNLGVKLGIRSLTLWWLTVMIADLLQLKKTWKEASKSKTTVKYLILLYLTDFSHVACFTFHHRRIRGQTLTWQTYTSYFKLCNLRDWIVAWSNESSKSIVSVASACDNFYCAREIYITGWNLIVWVKWVLRKTVVGAWRFNILALNTSSAQDAETSLFTNCPSRDSSSPRQSNFIQLCRLRLKPFNFVFLS